MKCIYTLSNGGVTTRSLGWCREEASRTLATHPVRFKPTKFDIHGIWSSREVPSNPWLESAADRQNSIDLPVLSLSHIMITAIASILGWEPGTQDIPENMVFATSDGEHTYNPIPKNVNAIRTRCGVYPDNEAAPQDMPAFVGSITNIPGHWADSVPIISYLMYLPRFWVGLYHPNIRELSKVKNSAKALPSYMKDHSLGASRRSNCMWLWLAVRLMPQSWYLRNAQAPFWTFTYILINHLMAACEGEQIDGKHTIQELLLETYGINGFVSWTRKNVIGSGVYKSLFSDLSKYGPIKFIDPNPIPNT